MSFDLLSFGRKNAKNVATSCIVHGARVKLEGHCDDTVIGLAKLASQQVKDVRFSFPKTVISETHQKGETHVYEPAKAAIAINNGEPLKAATSKNRGGVDEAVLNGTK